MVLSLLQSPSCFKTDSLMSVPSPTRKTSWPTSRLQIKRQISLPSAQEFSWFSSFCSYCAASVLGFSLCPSLQEYTASMGVSSPLIHCLCDFTQSSPLCLSQSSFFSRPVLNKNSKTQQSDSSLKPNPLPKASHLLPPSTLRHALPLNRCSQKWLLEVGPSQVQRNRAQAWPSSWYLGYLGIHQDNFMPGIITVPSSSLSMHLDTKPC